MLGPVDLLDVESGYKELVEVGRRDARGVAEGESAAVVPTVVPTVTEAGTAAPGVGGDEFARSLVERGSAAAVPVGAVAETSAEGAAGVGGDEFAMTLARRVMQWHLQQGQDEWQQQGEEYGVVPAPVLLSVEVRGADGGVVRLQKSHGVGSTEAAGTGAGAGAAAGADSADGAGAGAAGAGAAAAAGAASIVSSGEGIEGEHAPARAAAVEEPGAAAEQGTAAEAVAALPWVELQHQAEAGIMLLPNILPKPLNQEVEGSVGQKPMLTMQLPVSLLRGLVGQNCGFRVVVNPSYQPSRGVREGVGGVTSGRVADVVWSAAALEHVYQQQQQEKIWNAAARVGGKQREDMSQEEEVQEEPQWQQDGGQGGREQRSGQERGEEGLEGDLQKLQGWWDSGEQHGSGQQQQGQQQQQQQEEDQKQPQQEQEERIELQLPGVGREQQQQQQQGQEQQQQEEEEEEQRVCLHLPPHADLLQQYQSPCYFMAVCLVQPPAPGHTIAARVMAKERHRAATAAAAGEVGTQATAGAAAVTAPAASAAGAARPEMPTPTAAAAAAAPPAAGEAAPPPAAGGLSPRRFERAVAVLPLLLLPELAHIEVEGLIQHMVKDCKGAEPAGSNSSSSSNSRSGMAIEGRGEERPSSSIKSSSATVSSSTEGSSSSSSSGRSGVWEDVAAMPGVYCQHVVPFVRDFGSLLNSLPAANMGNSGASDVSIAAPTAAAAPAASAAAVPGGSGGDDGVGTSGGDCAAAAAAADVGMGICNELGRTAAAGVRVAATGVREAPSTALPAPSPAGSTTASAAVAAVSKTTSATAAATEAAAASSMTAADSAAGTGEGFVQGPGSAASHPPQHMLLLMEAYHMLGFLHEQGMVACASLLNEALVSGGFLEQGEGVESAGGGLFQNNIWGWGEGGVEEAAGDVGEDGGVTGGEGHVGGGIIAEEVEVGEAEVVVGDVVRIDETTREAAAEAAAAATLEGTAVGCHEADSGPAAAAAAPFAVPCSAELVPAPAAPAVSGAAAPGAAAPGAASAPAQAAAYGGGRVGAITCGDPSSSSSSSSTSGDAATATETDAAGGYASDDESSSYKPSCKTSTASAIHAPQRVGLKTCWQGFSNRGLEVSYQQYKARQLLGLDLAVSAMKLAEVVATVLKGLKLMKEHAGAAGVVRSVMLYLLFSVAPSLLLVTSPQLYWQKRDAVVFWSTVGSILGAFPLAVVLYWLGVGLDMALARDILGKIYQRPVAVISWVHLVVPLTLQLRVQRYLVILGLRGFEGWGIWWLVLRGMHSGWWLLGVMGMCAGLAVVLLLLLDLQLRRRFVRGQRGEEGILKAALTKGILRRLKAE